MEEGQQTEGSAGLSMIPMTGSAKAFRFYERGLAFTDTLAAERVTKERRKHAKVK